MKKLTIFNRPLSPHITIYYPQNSSVLSIWHRFSALILVITLILKISILKFYLINIPFNFYWENWFMNFFYILIMNFFLYHLLNGIRHIFWDLDFSLTKKLFDQSANYLIYLIFILNIINF